MAGSVRAALAIVLLAAPAHAERWRTSAEAGAEYDTNVHRVEVDPEGTTQPTEAALARAGARFDGDGDGAGGRWAFGGQGLVRKVAGDVSGEDVGVVAGDGRWDRPLGERRARAGARASYYDVLAFDPGGARAFALATADAVIAVAAEEGARFALTAGVRDFRYKPDDDFDWRGVAVAARFATTIWRRGDPAADTPDDAAATLDLAAGYRVDRRGFRGNAFVNGCGPDDPIEPPCFVPTDDRRADLHHVADLELVYTGDVVAQAGYQLAVNDSSSYGQSLVRHRLTASVTAEVPGGVFATVIGALQLDDYLDPLLLARDVTSQTFTSIDEENRSAVSVRLSRPLAGGWALEGRWAFSADSLSEDDLEFRRHVVYGGVTWNSDR